MHSLDIFQYRFGNLNLHGDGPAFTATVFPPMLLAVVVYDYLGCL